MKVDHMWTEDDTIENLLKRILEHVDFSRLTDQQTDTAIRAAGRRIGEEIGHKLIRGAAEVRSLQEEIIGP